MNNAGLISNVHCNVHCWKEIATLIPGDSMLNGLDERRPSKKGNVKVRAFLDLLQQTYESIMFSNC